MRHRLISVLIACVFLSARSAEAHRLDEYLQATILSLEPGTVSLTMRFVPGVAVSSGVIAVIDHDGDGVLSQAEQTAYAERAMSDLDLTEDNRTLKLRIVHADFPTIEQMRAGVGEITLTMAADISSASGDHQLAFENHHQPRMSVYLVNALVPQDTQFEITSQTRNQNQSLYRLSFTESASDHTVAQGFHLSGFAGAFRLGVRHIAEGTDHLLFLLTLLLPAPLLAVDGRWCQSATVRNSLLHILGIVTAFTVGHSLTLALSAFGLVRLPSRPVEVLIAVSILVSAIHALRPIFPGKESAVACFFGLIHGMAFASTLNELGVTGWYRVVSLLGFNLGIEAMQLVVVLMILPSFLLLRRTRFYAPFRTIGGCVAGCAAIAWIFERITGQISWFASIVITVAQHGIGIAIALLVGSSLAYVFTDRFSDSRSEALQSQIPPTCAR